ncbi:MAG: hypothetical protein AAB922_03180 [Patescibacteria group bacterium]
MKTYFFEKENGEVFACEATEGDQVMRDVNRRTKLIGVSEGKKYAEVMKEWKPKRSDVEEEELSFQAEYKAIQDKAFAAELEIAKGHIEYPPDLSVSGDKDAVQFVKKNGR